MGTFRSPRKLGGCSLAPRTTRNPISSNTRISQRIVGSFNCFNNFKYFNSLKGWSVPHSWQWNQLQQPEQCMEFIKVLTIAAVSIISKSMKAMFLIDSCLVRMSPAEKRYWGGVAEENLRLFHTIQAGKTILVVLPLRAGEQRPKSPPPRHPIGQVRPAGGGGRRGCRSRSGPPGRGQPYPVPRSRRPAERRWTGRPDHGTEVRTNKMCRYWDGVSKENRRLLNRSPPLFQLLPSPRILEIHFDNHGEYRAQGRRSASLPPSSQFPGEILNTFLPASLQCPPHGGATPAKSATGTEWARRTSGCWRRSSWAGAGPGGGGGLPSLLRSGPGEASLPHLPPRSASCSVVDPSPSSQHTYTATYGRPCTRLGQPNTCTR